MESYVPNVKRIASKNNQCLPSVWGGYLFIKGWWGCWDEHAWHGYWRCPLDSSCSNMCPMPICVVVIQKVHNNRCG